MPVPDYDLLIVGSGLCGVALAIQTAKKMPHARIGILEKESELGGTWNLNTYPGAGCDVPSHLYSYSFALNPNWTRFMSRQEEIWQYQRDVAKKFNTRQYIKFETSCEGATWDANQRTWTAHCVSEKDGSKFEITARALVPAVGGLHIPNDCDIKGADKFQGSLFHSARWDHTKTYKDKNVIVVGNGCSATQFVPLLVQEAKQVRQFVRSMHYLMPNPDFVYSEKAKKRFAKYPMIMALYRGLLAGVMDFAFIMFFIKGIGGWMRGHYEKTVRQYIIDKCPPKYRDIIVPDFKIGCKRRVMDTGYLACLHKDNMDVTRDAIVEIKEHSVITKSGQEYPADLIVLANGFKVGKFILDIRGINGESLDDHWERVKGPSAYFSTCVSGFPNMFLSMGPNAATGHFSYLFTSECQNNFIISLLEQIIPRNGEQPGSQKVLMVTPSAEKADSDWIDSQTAKTIVGQQGGCQSWYTTGTRNIALYPHFQMHFWWRSVNVRWQDFVLDGRPAGGSLGALAGSAAVPVAAAAALVGLYLRRGRVQ